MKLNLKNPPRKFKLRDEKEIIISDMGEVILESDEQVTFVTSNGKRHDFVAKPWGFYATPSVNSRLKKEGFKTALVKNEFGQIYIMVVDAERLELFDEYCVSEEQTVLEWLDQR